MTPPSKLKRELGRLFRVSHWQALLRFQYQLFMTWALGAPEHEDISAYFPALNREDTFICFVVYAPTGIREDTREALRQLAEGAQLRVLVVANHLLTPSDRRFLEGLNVAFVQGDNQGRDFGPYRDFCLSLATRQSTCDQPICRRLVLMNDSIAFPFQGRAVDMFDGFDGAAIYGMIEQRNSRVKSDHLCSFCLSFPPSVLQDPTFLGFWQRYSPRADRYYTIRAGEVTLSRTLRAAGYDLRAKYTKSRLLEAIAQAQGAKLPQAWEAARVAQLGSAQDIAAWRNSCLESQRQGLAALVGRHQGLRLLPLFAVFLRLPFAKQHDLHGYPGLKAWYAKAFDQGQVDLC